MSGNYEGSITGLSGDVLLGWARNLDRTDEPVVVQLYMAGEALQTAVANVYQTDQSAWVGFRFELTDQVLDQSGALQVRVANTATWLPGQVELSSAVSITYADSDVYCDGGLRLVGWVRRADELSAAQMVSITTDTGYSTEVRADSFAPMAPYSNKFCGFDVTLPLALADGRTHAVQVGLENGEHLNGSPVMVACHPEGEWHEFQATFAEVANTPSGQLFAGVLEENRHYAPRSLGMECYPQWFELFADPNFSADQADGERPVIKPFYIGKDAELPEDADYVAVLSVRDRLTAWALDCLTQAIADAPEPPGIVYTDSDRDGPNGERSEPWFKPAWDSILFEQQNYLAPLCVVASSVIEELKETDLGAWPHSAVKQCLEMDLPIKHLPVICCHQPYTKTRTKAAPEAKPPVLRSQPLVSVIIPTRDALDYLEACINSLATTHYSNIEIIVVNNRSCEPDALAYLDKLRHAGVTVLDYNAPFNYAAMNNLAVEVASGEVICLLNNDTEVIEPAWLDYMLAQLERDDVGIVGAKLIWPNRMVQHAGVLLGMGHMAGHYGNRLMDEEPGYFDTNRLPRRVSAVTGACLLMAKSDFEALQGFNELDYPVAFNDVDLCLRLTQQLNKVCLIEPRALLQHGESASRGRDNSPEKRARSQREINLLRLRWGDALLCDSAYNPNLNLDALAGAYGGLAFPPRQLLLR